MPDPALEARTRIDLAVAFRWAARLGMHEAVANHFSAAVSDDGSRFLLNPVGAHFSRICAGDLLLRDAAEIAAAAAGNLAAEGAASAICAWNDATQRTDSPRASLRAKIPNW